MWTRAKVDKLLEDYQADTARAEHLRLELKSLNSAVDAIMKTLDEDEASLKAQQITGMPHGTDIQNPTERIAIRLASGWVPSDVREMREQIRLYETELRDKELTTFYVDAWLSSLPEREEWLIKKQVIQHTFWRDVIDDYARVFQVRLSQDSLSRMKKRAMDKIYRTAGAVD